MLLSLHNQTKRKLREKKTAEIFTPDFLVKEMLDKLPKCVWEPGRTCCDPAVGHGQFLIHALARKIKNGESSLNALKTLYGVDIMADNVHECRLRLLKVCLQFGGLNTLHIRATLANIVCADALKYDFEFDHNVTTEMINKLANEVRSGALNGVEIPKFNG